MHAWLEVLANTIGLTFAYAVYAKVRNRSGLLEAVRAYRMLPRPVVFPSVVFLILLELAVAIAHLLRVQLDLFAPVTEILLIAFLILSVVGNSRAPNGPCLCFGAETGERFGTKVLIRLGAMVVIESLLLWQVVVHSESDESLIVGNSVNALVVAASILLLFLWVSSFSDFVFLTRTIRRRFRIGNGSRVVSQIESLN